jgi:hypothetical protein
MGATSSFPPAWGISERVPKDEGQKVSRSWRNLRPNARQLAARTPLAVIYSIVW